MAYIGDENANRAPAFLWNGKEQRHVKAASFQANTIPERSTRVVCRGYAREGCTTLKPGIEQDELLRKARRADTASHLDEWINSSGLQPPR